MFAIYLDTMGKCPKSAQEQRGITQTAADSYETKLIWIHVSEYFENSEMNIIFYNSSEICQLPKFIDGHATQKVRSCAQ